MADKQLQFEATVSAAALNKLLGDLQNGAEGAARAINDALGGTVTKKLLLETVTDVSGAKSLVAVEKERLSVADQINNKLNQLRKTERGSVTSLRQQVNEARQARDSIVRYVDAIGGIGGQLRTVNPLWAAQNARVGELQRQLDLAATSGFWSQIKTGFRLQGFISFLNGLTEITQGLQSATIVLGQFTGAINDLLNSAAELQSFALSFEAIGAGSAGAVKGLQDSAEIALGLGVNLQTVQDGFRQLSPVILNSGGALQDVTRIVEALSSRFAAYGISGDKARRVTNGVIQAFAKGKLQAEELTQQISEADPAFKTELAEAIKASITELKGFGEASDFTVQKLEEFVKQGKITTDVLIKVLPALSKADLLFGKLGPTANTAVDALANGSVTIDQVRANLDNLGKLNLRNIAKIADPLIVGFLRINAVVTDFFTRLSESATARTLVDVFGRIANIAARVVDSFLTVADGVLSVTNAIAPFVDILLKIPGAIELVATALAGKLLKSFGLLRQNVQDGIKSLTGFESAFGSSLAGLKTPVAAAQKSFDTFKKKLEEPVAFKVSSNLGTDIKQIEQSGNTASQSIEKTSIKGVKAVDKQIAKTTQKIQELRASLAALGDAPTFEPLPRPEPSQSNEAPSFRGNVNAAIQEYDRLQKKSKELGETVSQTARDLVVGNQLLSSTSFGKVISLETLQGLRDLASTDPARGVELLRAAISRTAAELGKLEKGTPAYAEVSTRLAALNQELPRTEKLARNIGAEFQANASLQDAAAKAAAEQAEASKQSLAAYNQGLSEYNAKQQTFVNGIKEAKNELKSLAEQRAALTGGRQTAAAVPDYERPVAALDVFQNKLNEVSKTQETAFSSWLSYLQKEKQETKAALDDIIAKRKAAAQAAQQFRIPIGDLGESGDAATDRADRLRDRLAALQAAEGQAIASSRRLAASAFDLAAALEKAGDSSASYAERKQGISQAASLLSKFLGATIGDIEETTKKIRDLEKARNDLLKQQSARPFTGPVDRQKDPLLIQIDDLGSQIEELKGKLGELDGSRELAFDGLESLGGAFEDNERRAGAFGGALGRLRGGFRGFAGGIITAPFRALGSLFTSARVAAIGLLEAIGPLQIILIAAGIASRLYADGNRKSAQISKEFAESTELLNAALKDLNPEAQETGNNSSALARTWQALANATAKIGNAIGGFIEGAARSLERFTNGLKNALGPLAEFIAKIALVGGGGVLGALLGAPFGPWGVAIGAALGGASAAAIALAVSASETDLRVAELDQSLKTLREEVDKQAPAIEELNSELDKLAKGGKVEPKNLTKYVNGINAVEAALSQQRDRFDESSGALKQNEATYKENISQLGKYREELAAAQTELKKLREQQGDADPRGERASAYSIEIQQQQALVDGLKGKIAELEEQTIGLGTSNNAAAEELNRLNRELEEGEKELDNRRKALGLVTGEQENLLNSLSKLKNEIQSLEESAGSFDLLSDKGRQGLSAALIQARALQTVFDELSKTEIEISIETQGLQQSIAESQLTIDLDPGPLREAALSVSKVTNDLATAQQAFQKAIAEYALAEERGTLNAKTRAELTERSARVFLDAALKGKAAIVEAAREFKDQLDNAKSSYQELLLSKPEFFTPGEVRANAQQIEKDFAQALNKVRQDTGDWTWGPKLDGKTYDEILAQKKAFIDARKQADELVDSIKQLNKVLSGLALVLAKISGVSLEQLQAAEFDPSKIIKGAQDSQQAITGLGAAAQDAARAYGEIIGTVEGGGQKLVLAVNEATGQVESLTEEEYNAANASKALEKTGVGAFNALGSAAGNALGGVFGQTQSYKTVIGELEAGGEKLLIIQDQFNGRTDTVTSKMAAQMGIVNNLADAYKNLGIQIAKSQEQTPLAPSTYPTPTAQTIEIAASLNIDPGITQQVRDAAQQAGGDFTRTFAQLIATDSQNSGTMFAQGVLGNLGTAVTNYKYALETLAIAERQAKEAQDQYNAAVAIGGASLYTAAGAVANANDALEAAQNAAATAGAAYDDAAESARALGIDMKTVTTIGETLEDTGPRTLADSYEKARKKALEFYDAIQEVPEDSSQVEQDLSGATSSLQEGIAPADQLSGSLANGAEEAQNIASAISSLDGLSVNVNVNGVPGLWTGGPTQAGQLYQVNELGQEGFLSPSGVLKPIQRPKNALWRAPSSGTVIPAHLWSQINVPVGGVHANSGQPAMAGHNSNPLGKVARAIQAGLGNGSSRQELAEIARVQAHQATQIGKLASAVRDLASKDWNVSVGVRSTGDAAFLDAINHRL